jgi:hypothetical protein
MSLFVNDSQKGTKTGARQKKAIDDGGVNAEKLQQVEKESTKCCLEMNHGLLVEALKKFMFTQQTP